MIKIMKGKVVAVCISEKKGTPKKNIGEGEVIEDFGLQGDAHADKWHRQVSLLALESIEEMRKKGLNVGPGDFAENITTKGIKLETLPIGTKLQIGNVLLEVTQIGKVCPRPCAVFYRVGDCIMPKKGIFAKVIKGGRAKVGDEITVIEHNSQIAGSKSQIPSTKSQTNFNDQTPNNDKGI